VRVNVHHERRHTVTAVAGLYASAAALLSRHRVAGRDSGASRLPPYWIVRLARRERCGGHRRRRWVLLANLTLTDQLALGLPWLHWHLRLDPLSGFFFVLLSLLVLAISFYGRHYTASTHAATRPSRCRRSASSPRVHPRHATDDCLRTMLHVHGVLGNDVGRRLHACRLSAQHAANRQAAFLYLMLSHAGAGVILISFRCARRLSAAVSPLTRCEQAELSPMWATLAFALAFIGFGVKAGIVPLHVWLPERTVAPSHISALMSGAMIKMGFMASCPDL